MAKTAFKGTPVTLAGEFVKAGTSAPEVCPVCSYSQSYFEVHKKNY